MAEDARQKRVLTRSACGKLIAHACNLTMLLTAIHSTDVAGAMSMGPGLLIASVYIVGCVRTKLLSLGMRYRTIVVSLPWMPASSIPNFRRQANMLCCRTW